MNYVEIRKYLFKWVAFATVYLTFVHVRVKISWINTVPKVINTHMYL